MTNKHEVRPRAPLPAGTPSLLFAHATENFRRLCAKCGRTGQVHLDENGLEVGRCKRYVPLYKPAVAARLMRVAMALVEKRAVQAVSGRVGMVRTSTALEALGEALLVLDGATKKKRAKR